MVNHWIRWVSIDSCIQYHKIESFPTMNINGFLRRILSKQRHKCNTQHKWTYESNLYVQQHLPGPRKRKGQWRVLCHSWKPLDPFFWALKYSLEGRIGWAPRQGPAGRIGILREMSERQYGRWNVRWDGMGEVGGSRGWRWNEEEIVMEWGRKRGGVGVGEKK